jgi:hypothetical protein
MAHEVDVVLEIVSETNVFECLATDLFALRFAQASWSAGADLTVAFVDDIGFNHDVGLTGGCGARYRPDVQRRMRPGRLIEIFDAAGIYPVPWTSRTSPGRSVLRKALAASSR